MKESGCGRSDRGSNDKISFPPHLVCWWTSCKISLSRIDHFESIKQLMKCCPTISSEYCPLIRPKPLPHHFLFWWCPKSNFLPAQSIVSRVKVGQRPKFDEILFFWNSWALNCGDYPNKLRPFKFQSSARQQEKRIGAKQCWDGLSYQEGWWTNHWIDEL